MFQNPTLARKYARALHDATGGKAELANLDIASERVHRALTAPAMNYAALTKLVGQPSGPEAANLLKLLCRRKRHRLLPEIAAMYERITDEEKGIRHATVTTAIPMERQTQEKIHDTVKGMTNAKAVKLHIHEDEKLLGGVVIRIGDTLIDGSVKSKLDAFRQKFA